ncbi:hypothetical protein ACGF7W_19660 [Streptomyces sp. NPDC048219]|uniref:hypothetical protein n=1 Tax=Streptomyces sp. NPDC048219 TaxID=3365517 RepID=UPI00370FEA30
MTEPQLFHLQRDRDVSGVSGTGRVAHGVRWPDGTVTLRWVGDRPSTVHWDQLEDAIAIHGHGGATRLVWTDPQPAGADRAAVLREAADAVFALEYDVMVGDEGDENLGSMREAWDVGTIHATQLLRRMADETPAAETHACANCGGVDPDTCLNNPHRPPEQCPRSEADGYGLQCQKPAGHNLCTFEEQPAAGARQDGAQPS